SSDVCSSDLQRIQRNGPLHGLADPTVRAAAALGRKGGHQLGIPLVTLGGVKHGLQKAGWRTRRTWSTEVHAHGLEDLRHVRFVADPVLGRDLAMMKALQVRVLILDLGWLCLHAFTSILVIESQRAVNEHATARLMASPYGGSTSSPLI